MIYLSLVTPFVLLIGVVIGLFYFKRYPGVLKCILGYLFVMLSIEALSMYFGLINAAKNNLFLFSLVALVNGVFYSIFYGVFLLKKRRIWLISISLSAVLWLILVVITKSGVPITAFESYEMVLADGLVCLCAVVSSYDLITRKEKINPNIMRANAPILLFFSLDLLIQLTSNFLLNTGKSYIYFWVLRLVMMVFLYSAFTLFLWRLGRNPKQLPFG